ncbi:PspC domain-containing protein [Epilithonimonas mollis]|uniref:Phage shock protein C (PspC) family protein n=1 Tax=Epilithonimonas mollis TaxID=216903 RepID=A0A1M6TED0_9FLAO|nr:PspC domain-containing protein [Epilithonimonas mollis]SHK55330.1 phage shock protein C (PspC) family protein [Epilithonimonas mollis]
MNKTLSIALAGFSFMIDEQAYIKLSDYLNALRNSLDAQEADEVMHDIEIRMVEIFKETLSKREVINDSDVEKVIAQIGTPEQIDEQEEAYYSEGKQSKSKSSTSYSSYSSNSQKQLFRDPERQKIAGVCAGLAAYFGMDITWMRLIWVGAFLFLWIAPGSSFLVVILYFILWAVLPKAESASDFLKMKGKPLNFDNLKEESSKIVQFANETTTRAGEIYTENRPKIGSAGDSILKIFRYCLAVLLGLLAAGCFIGLFAMTFAYGSDKFGMDNNLGFYLEENNLGYLLLAIAALPTIIFGVAFLLLSIKLFSPKTKFNYIGRVLGTLGIIWIILVGIFAASASKFNFSYSGDNQDYENISITAPNDTIYLDSKKVAIPENYKAYFNNIYSDKSRIYKRDYASVEITRRDDIKTPYLIIKKEADGYNQPLKMKVPVEITGNRIFFPNYFEYPYEYKFRDYRLDYELVVPSTMKVINEKEYEINVRDNSDDDDNDFSSSNHSGITVEENKIKINGTTIEYNSDDSDSVKINGKNYSKDSADVVLERMKIDQQVKKSFKDMNINIKDGKKEIHIKTN